MQSESEAVMHVCEREKVCVYIVPYTHQGNSFVFEQTFIVYPFGGMRYTTHLQTTQLTHYKPFSPQLVLGCANACAWKWIQHILEKCIIRLTMFL